MKILSIRLFLFFAFICCLHSKNTIVINELCPSNYASSFDDEMDSPDWIELYNPTDSDVQLEGYGISDGNDYGTAWKFPARILPSKSYQLIYASGKDRKLPGNLTIEASGFGVSNVYNYDGFRFEYVEAEGDFDIRIRVESFRNAEHFGTAGLMIREELRNNSKYAGIFCRPEEVRWIVFHHRAMPESRAEIKGSLYKPNYPDRRLRLRRHGDSITASMIDKDSYDIEKFTIYFPAAQKLYVGIAVSAASRTRLAKAVVSEMFMDGLPLDMDDFSIEEFNTDFPGRKYISDELHTDFRLSKSGETAYLFAPDGEIIDSVRYDTLRTDISYGRFPDGWDNFEFFLPATPGTENQEGFKRITGPPRFSISGGWFSSPQQVALSPAAGGDEIYYTLDGSLPTKDSATRYEDSPIAIDSTTVVRAVAFGSFGIPSQAETYTFFINEETTLPVYSLSTDPRLLFSEEEGLFHPGNIWPSRQVPLHFEIWDGGRLEFSGTAEARLSGKVSRTYPQQSIRFSARSNYDLNNFEYSFFGNKSLGGYEHFILRNSGQDWDRAFIRDAFCMILAEGLGNLGKTLYRPVIGFVNGRYWGIYNLRERLNEDFLAEKYNLPERQINIIEQRDYVVNGTSKSYYEMLDSITLFSANPQESLEIANRRIDMDNFLDYGIFNIFCGNFDWPFNNTKYWNSEEYDGKWRWYLYDMDWTFGLFGSGPYNNVLERALNPDTSEYSRLLTRFLLDDGYKHLFINRFAYLLNTHFLPDKVVGILDSLMLDIEPEVPRHKARWEDSMKDWQAQADRIRWFAKEKPGYERGYIIDQFDLPGMSNLRLNVIPEGAGYFKLSTIEVGDLPWEGIYFQGVPVRLEALANSGYEFSAWSDSEFGTEKDITIYFTKDLVLTAEFRESETPEVSIVINEIMYKSSEAAASGDWIELYNYGKSQLDIAGWTIKDNNNGNSFTIAGGTIIEAGGYIVICRSPADFKSAYPGINNFIGEFSFGFGPEDAVRLFDSDGKLVDIVEYTSSPPWYPQANGGGPSLELINPKSDNALPNNWNVNIDINGTPGKVNSIYDSVPQATGKFAAMCFPNPAAGLLAIRIDVPVRSIISISLINSLGITASEIERSKAIESGGSILTANTGNLPPGAYYLNIYFESPAAESIVIPITIIR